MDIASAFSLNFGKRRLTKNVNEIEILEKKTPLMGLGEQSCCIYLIRFISYQNLRRDVKILNPFGDVKGIRRSTV